MSETPESCMVQCLNCGKSVERGWTCSDHWDQSPPRGFSIGSSIFVASWKEDEEGVLHIRGTKGENGTFTPQFKPTRRE